MSDINFLDNKKYGDDQKPKDKNDKKDKLIWSNPKKEVKGPKSSAFSFLPFINKKEPVNKNSALTIDKNKIKRSREEILNLIKRHENSKPPPKEKSKNFLAALVEKLKKQPGRKEVLINYQRVFNQEKEHKNQVGKIFNVESAPKAAGTPPLIPPLKGGRGGLDWFGWLKKLFKNKMTRPAVGPGQTAGIIKSAPAEEIKPAPIIQSEETPAEVKEIKIEEKKPIQQNEIRQRVLETNLIQGELVTFFDWRHKVIILASAILMPIFMVGAVYYGLVFYQKSNQAKNLAQAKKFAELEQDIMKEESGLKEILAFQARLKTVSQIFKQHLYWTNFFKFLEDNTIKDVYFINFDGDTGGSYIMDVSAASYSNIAEQVKVFRNNKKITAVEVAGGQLASGDDKNKSLVKFILNFSILKSIFTE